MRRFVMAMFALVVGVALVVSAVSAVGAQGGSKDPSPVPVVPPLCENVGPYDLNGDGVLTGRDFDMWVWTVHESRLCQLDAPLGTCPPKIDVNRDGFVSHADLNAMFDFLFQCVYGPWRTKITP